MKLEQPKNHFTVGITDDVTNTSLPVDELIDVASEGTTRCKFYGLGSDGTVGANKNSIKIIGDHTDLYAQGYFEYDSKKSGGLTISHLRFGKTPIKSSYLIDQAEFIACHNPSYVTRYDILGSAKEGGTFLLNCAWTTDELDEKLPAVMKNQIARKHLKFYIINGLEIAKKAGSAKSTNMVMQSAFFKLANIIPYEEAEGYMKAAILKTYGKKGQAVIDSNNAAVENAVTGLIEVNYPESWADATTGAALPEKSTTSITRNSSSPLSRRRATSSPYRRSIPRASFPRARPSSKSAVSRLISPYGTKTTASSVTSALSFVRTRQSVPFSFPSEPKSPLPSKPSPLSAFPDTNSGFRSVRSTARAAEAARTSAPQRTRLSL